MKKLFKVKLIMCLALSFALLMTGVACSKDNEQKTKSSDQDNASVEQPNDDVKLPVNNDSKDIKDPKDSDKADKNIDTTKQWLSTKPQPPMNFMDVYDYLEANPELAKKVLKQMDNFALKFMNNVGEEDFVISPISLYYAMACLRLGAEGAAAEEMDQLMRPEGITDEEYLQTLSIFSSLLNLKDKLDTIEIGQLILAKPGMEWSADYIAKVERLNSDLGNLDFTNQADAIEKLNSWADYKTHGMIPKLFEQPSELNPQIVFMILNAIYFEGEWKDVFAESDTQEDTFYAVKGEQTVDYMKRIGDYSYAEKDGIQYLLMPYKGRSYLEIALGKKDQDVKEVLQALFHSDDLKFDTYEVNVKIPKFERSMELDLNGIIADMGAPTIFKTLGKNTYFANDNGDLLVDETKQWVAFDLNEKGTKAAAVTMIATKESAMPVEEVNKAEFIADHPFAYRIVNEGLTLFSGVFSDADAGN